MAMDDRPWGTFDKRSADHAAAMIRTLERRLDRAHAPRTSTGKSDLQAWLTEVLSRVVDHRITWIDGLLPWRYAATAA
jgi:hypothetical protein